jgi:hypothetical protein
MMHEKKRKESSSKAKQSKYQLGNQKGTKEKIKLHFTCWESNPPPLPQRPTHCHPVVNARYLKFFPF